MRIRHKINHGWAPNRNDAEWERRVEREAAATTDATERAFIKAQERLNRAEARLAHAAAAAAVAPRRLAMLERAVEARRQELLDLMRTMQSNPASSTHRGRKSHRGIPGTQPL